MPTPTPRWPRETTTRANELANDFKSGLRTVAESFAQHEGAEAVLVRHVDEAHSALARLGLNRKRWFRRPEFATAGGGLLVGLAFACPDIVTVFVPSESSLRTGLTVAAFSVAFCVGLFLFCFGWYKGTVPSPPGK